MGRFTYSGFEYFIDGPGKGGKFSWRIIIGGKTYAGSKSSRSEAETVVKEIINRKK